MIITGALGHIGSALIRQQLNPVAPVHIVDDLSTQRYCSLYNLPYRVKFWHADFNALEESDLAADTVVHLAAITDAAGSFHNLEAIERVNIEGTKKLIDKAVKAGCKRFIFPSSTSVYGCDMAVMDEDAPVNPQSPYAASKIAIEEYLATSGLDYVILRFGTIFGPSPGMRFHTAINKFCFQAARGLPITVWRENYEMVRPYLGINDAIQAIRMATHMPKGLYNVVSCNHKLSDIILLLGNVQIQWIDTPLSNQYSYEVSTDRIQRLGFVTRDRVGAGISETLQMLGGL